MCWVVEISTFPILRPSSIATVSSFAKYSCYIRRWYFKPLSRYVVLRLIFISCKINALVVLSIVSGLLFYSICFYLSATTYFSFPLRSSIFASFHFCRTLSPFFTPSTCFPYHVLITCFHIHTPRVDLCDAVSNKYEENPFFRFLNASTVVQVHIANITNTHTPLTFTVRITHALPIIPNSPVPPNLHLDEKMLFRRVLVI